MKAQLNNTIFIQAQAGKISNDLRLPATYLLSSAVQKYLIMLAALFSKMGLSAYFIQADKRNSTFRQVTLSLWPVALEVFSRCIKSNRKMKPEVTGHWTRSHLCL